jgi:hypothetical protein
MLLHLELVASFLARDGGGGGPEELVVVVIGGFFEDDEEDTFVVVAGFVAAVEVHPSVSGGKYFCHGDVLWVTQF